MKIAISAENNNIDSLIDQRFGRCKYFIVVETEENKIKEIKVVENKGAIQGHGAGISAAQQIGNLEVDVVITGNLGPNSSNVLNQLGIKSYHSSGRAKDAVDKLIKEELELIKETSEKHSGMNIDEKLSDETGERIFFPLLEDKEMDSEISGHFGNAPFFGVYNVEKKELKIIKNDLDHSDPTKSPIDQIREAVNPTTIFAKGIGGRAIGIIKQKGLSLKTGNYETVRQVIENLDKLEDQDQSCGH